MKKIINLITVILIALLLISCDDINNPNDDIDLRILNPHHDVYYQIFVRSFADSDNDGIGDLNGLTENLDYLSDLGITALWLLPINPSPSYHGYDVIDYYDINPEYGTLEDFQNLITRAKEKDIKVVIDLVINHTSDQHPWYVSARNSQSSPFRDYYIWTGPNTAFESFVGGMKDLNLDNPEVVSEVKNIMDFYLEMGVHGFRLDAAKHFFDKPGQTGITLKNALFTFEINQHIKENYPNSFIVSEVFDYSYVSYQDYYVGSDSVFNFYAAGQMWDKIGRGNNRYLLTSNLDRMYEHIKELSPNFVDTPFLTNHDLDRLASMDGFNGYQGFDKMKLATRMLLTLPGSPFIYYGEELAMKGYRDYGQNGQNIPGYGIAYDEFRRTPFLWGDPLKQTTWFPDTQNSDTADLTIQKSDLGSMYHVYREIIHLRRENPALMFGNFFEPYKDNNSNIQGYVRYFNEEGIEQAILVIHNISVHTQTLDISYLNVLMGNLSLSPYETLIVEIDPLLIGDYI
jgi:alpha-amylase